MAWSEKIKAKGKEMMSGGIRGAVGRFQEGEMASGSLAWRLLWFLSPKPKEGESFDFLLCRRGKGLGDRFFMRKKKVRWLDLWGKKKNPRATRAAATG